MALTEHEKTAEFYYHGTNRFYYEQQMKKHGKYVHDGKNYLPTGEVFVSTNLGVAEGYARARTDRWFRFPIDPIVLKIYGDKVRERVCERHGISDISIDFLVEGEFEVLDIKPKA